MTKKKRDSITIYNPTTIHLCRGNEEQETFPDPTCVVCGQKSPTCHNINEWGEVCEKCIRTGLRLMDMGYELPEDEDL